jgi:hypothetical protein
MGILHDVGQTLSSIDGDFGVLGETLDALEHDAALKEAERLADLFAEVKPQPYVVPIQRFAGLPVFKGDNSK